VGVSLSGIGARIKSLREARGLSQRAISGPGVSPAFISRIENGQRLPSVKAIRVIAKRLGVSPQFLETGHELSAEGQRELRVAEAEVRLRLGEDRGRAERELRLLLVEAEEAGDGASMLRARVALGSAAYQRRDVEAAIELLEAALATGEVEPVGNPEFYAALAQSYLAVGESRRAIELIEGALERARDAELTDPAMTTRFATYLSFALTDLGDTARAREVLDEALEGLDQIADPLGRVRMLWSRARLAEAEGRHKAAQAEIEQAVALLAFADDSRNLARAHLLYAESLLGEGLDLERAEAHIAKAEPLLDPGLANHELAWLYVLKAGVLARAGKSVEAQSFAERALERLGEFDPEMRGRAEAARAEALFRAGEVDPAEEAFERAERLLEGAERRFRLQLFNAWSSALEQQGRLAEALGVARRAASLAAEVGPAREAAGSPTLQEG
jgi:tetratricopeptide (TPR) repeat protein